MQTDRDAYRVLAQVIRNPRRDAPFFLYKREHTLVVAILLSIQAVMQGSAANLPEKHGWNDIERAIIFFRGGKHFTVSAVTLGIWQIFRERRVVDPQYPLADACRTWIFLNL